MNLVHRLSAVLRADSFRIAAWKLFFKICEFYFWVLVRQKDKKCIILDCTLFIRNLAFKGLKNPEKQKIEFEIKSRCHNVTVGVF